MKQLLERWSQLEPHLCRQDWLGDYHVELSPGLMHIDLDKNTGLAMVQWVVQQAIVEKGWYLEMYYTPSTYNEAIITVPSKAKDKAYSQNSMAEALLTAYLKVLDDNPS